MTTSTTSLTDFLLARIADDEGQARADQADAMVGHRWKHAPEDVYNELQGVVLNWTRRVLAECQAKRRIVEELTPDHGDTSRWSMDGNHWSVLGLLALPYSDHPDYDESWRP